MKRIKVTFDRYEDDRTIFLTADKKEIILPKNIVTSQPGESFSIEIKDEHEAKSSDEKLAKAILNEILNQE